MSAAPALQRDAVPGLQALDRLPTTSTPTIPLAVRAADVFRTAFTTLKVPLNRKTTQNDVQSVRLATLEPSQELLPVAGLSAYVVKPRRDPPDVAHVVMRSGRERWVIQEGHTRLGAAVLRGDETLPARVWEFEQADTGDLVPVLRGLHRRGVQLTLRDAKPGLHPDWQLGETGLTRQITFPNLRACATFISSLMDAANDANHHPDVQNDNCDVTVTFITHATGTVTAKDYAGAEEADRLAGEALTVLSGDDLAVLLLDWQEELHPRDDKGQFAEGDGDHKPVAISARVASHPGVEMVSIKDLERFRTQDRRVDPKSSMNITEPTETLLPRLTRELQEGKAIQEPLTLAYDTKAGRIILIDGNTRLAAIADAGFTHAPVMITRQDLNGFGHPIAALSKAEAGIEPFRNWLLPSEVGFKTLPRSTSLSWTDDWDNGSIDLGGPGSGNFGHAGRPGEVGGSADGGGGGGDTVSTVPLREPTPHEFIEARNKSSRMAFLSPLTPDDLKGQKLYLSKDGTVGGAMTPGGDMGNLFNNDGPSGAAREVLLQMIADGGTTADAYDGYLPLLYTQFGLHETGRMAFNPEYAPKDWNYEKDDHPDVIFLALDQHAQSAEEIRERLADEFLWQTPNEPGDNYYDDYDQGKRDATAIATKHAIARHADAAAKRTESGGKTFLSEAGTTQGSRLGRQAWRSGAARSASAGRDLTYRDRLAYLLGDLPGHEFHGNQWTTTTTLDPADKASWYHAGGDWNRGANGETPYGWFLHPDGEDYTVPEITHKVVRDTGQWGGSHGGSQDITGAAAGQMGIDGYREAEWKRSSTIANRFLREISTDATGSEEVLHHVFENVAETVFTVGDTLRLPLTATSGDVGLSYGTRLDKENQTGHPTVFVFEKGTQMVAYGASASQADVRSGDIPSVKEGMKEAGHVWSEALVAGGFEVVSVETRYMGSQHDRSSKETQQVYGKVVHLRQTETFHPEEGWKPRG